MTRQTRTIFGLALGAWLTMLLPTTAPVQAAETRDLILAAYSVPKEARLKDERGTVAGHRITLFKGQKEAIVEGGEEQQRPTLILHKLPKKQADTTPVEAGQSDKKSEN